MSKYVTENGLVFWNIGKNPLFCFMLQKYWPLTCIIMFYVNNMFSFLNRSLVTLNQGVENINCLRTLLCSYTMTLSCCSRSLLTRAESRLEQQRGGIEGQAGDAPGPHTDRTASWDIDFQSASFFRLNLHTSTESDGWKTQNKSFTFQTVQYGNSKKIIKADRGNF